MVSAKAGRPAQMLEPIYWGREYTPILFPGPCDEPNPEVSSGSWKAGSLSSFLSTKWQYGGGCFITNFVPRVTKEVTWLSSWKSLAVKETGISGFVKHLLLWDELSPGRSLAWPAPPTCWRARLSKLQADEVKRLWEGHSSAAEKMNENSSMFPCQPERSLRRAEFGSSSSGCCRPRPFHGECPLDPCSLCRAWLAPSPSKQKKSKKNPNITRHNMHLPWFFFVLKQQRQRKRGGKKNN